MNASRSDKRDLAPEIREHNKLGRDKKAEKLVHQIRKFSFIELEGNKECKNLIDKLVKIGDSSIDEIVVEFILVLNDQGFNTPGSPNWRSLGELIQTIGRIGGPKAYQRLTSMLDMILRSKIYEAHTDGLQGVLDGLILLSDPQVSAYLEKKYRTLLADSMDIAPIKRAIAYLNKNNKD